LSRRGDAAVNARRLKSGDCAVLEIMGEDVNRVSPFASSERQAQSWVVGSARYGGLCLGSIGSRSGPQKRRKQTCRPSSGAPKCQRSSVAFGKSNSEVWARVTFSHKVVVNHGKCAACWAFSADPSIRGMGSLEI